MSTEIEEAGIKKEADRQFVDRVFPDEVKYVGVRRNEVYSRPDRKEHEKRQKKGKKDDGGNERAPLNPKPTVDNELVGLAFSGGGIRSATINLGIAQQLHRRGVLDHVDYLSTVSGGGYTGSSVSTIMRCGAEFPYEHTDGPTESPYLTWIRNHSNYLATNGLIDYVRIAALLFRGIALNLLVLVPGMLLISLVLGLYYGGDPVPRFLNRGVLHRWQDVGFGWSDAYNLLPWALAGAAVFFLAYPVVIKVFKVMTKEQSAETGNESSVKLRDFYERLHAWVFVIVGAVLAIETLPILLHWFHEAKEFDYRELVAGVGAGAAVVAVSSAAKVVKALGGVARKIAVALVGLLGLLVPLLFILYVGEALAYAPKGTIIDLSEAPGLILLALWALMTAGGLASLVAKRTSSIALVGIAGLIGAGIGVVILWLLLASGLPAAWFIFILAFVIWLFCWAGIDVNLTSMHGFYRDRLASAYLVGVDTTLTRKERERLMREPLTKIDPNKVDIEDDINLPDICQHAELGEGAKGCDPPASFAPYHIVNVAHNLQGSSDESIRERDSDFFFFSKYAIGGNHTGYCSSEHLEWVFPQMDLPTAMAISAAAAAPNMGKGTSGSMVAIMTLLNVRLGYWIPNPRRFNEWLEGKKKKIEPGKLWNRWVWRVRPWALVKEFFSKLDEKWKWVNLSDGGHLENLATYELLRRRCKYIITGDGEADPAMTFNGLADLMRFARIDMGVEIEILLDDLRLARIDTGGEIGKVLDEIRVGPKNNSYQHAAFGRIHYPAIPGGPGKETGYLVYLKSSVTGDEDEVINEYRANNPAFPHESTADQFFSEGQFEAYRDLGYHMAASLFDEADPGGTRRMTFARFKEWFEDLEADLAPRMAAESLFIELQSELGEIRSELQQPEFEEYFYEIHPDLKPSGWSSPAAADPALQTRRLVYLVGEQLRLMENVFVELNFERPRNWRHEGNRGWRNLFESWAEADSFKRIFPESIGMHGPKFREFCQKRLNLP